MPNNNYQQDFELYQKIGEENPIAKQHLDDVMKYVGMDKLSSPLRQMAQVPRDQRDQIAKSFRDANYPNTFVRGGYLLEDIIKKPVNIISSGLKDIANLFIKSNQNSQQLASKTA